MRLIYNPDHMPRHTSRAGFTMTELSIVFIVVALLLSAVWVGVGQYTLSNQVRITAQQLVTIAHNVRGIFAEQGGVMGGTGSNINPALDQMQAFPIEMRQGATPTGVIFHIWSPLVSNGLGTVQVYADDCTGTETGATPQSCFGINLFNVPQLGCIKLLMQAAQVQAVGLQGVIVNPPVGTLLAPPVSLTQAENGCANASNTIQWIYLLKG